MKFKRISVAPAKKRHRQLSQSNLNANDRGLSMEDNSERIDLEKVVTDILAPNFMEESR